MRNVFLAAVSRVAIICLTAPLVAVVAEAADLVSEETVVVPEAVEYRDIIIDLGFGGQLEPKFPSAKKYVVNPWPIASLEFLRLPFFGEVVTGEEAPFYVYPSFDFIDEREEDDARYLDGLGDTDFAVELGLGAAAQYSFVKVFAEVRYGITGHNGFVGEGGIDFKYEDPRWEVAIGPRVSLASDDYMDEYFSVSRSATRLPEYQADGGFKDVGVELAASYAITEKVRLQGKAEYTHFVGDAQDSPIVESGNDDEFMVGLGLTYRFGLDLY